MGGGALWLGLHRSPGHAHAGAPRTRPRHARSSRASFTSWCLAPCCGRHSCRLRGAPAPALAPAPCSCP
eukprot:5835097-Prymnesium_polylepis.1